MIIKCTQGDHWGDHLILYANSVNFDNKKPGSDASVSRFDGGGEMLSMLCSWDLLSNCFEKLIAVPTVFEKYWLLVSEPGFLKVLADLGRKLKFI